MYNSKSLSILSEQHILHWHRENISIQVEGTLWSWSYGSCIYNYLWNQCLSPLKLCIRTPFMVRCTWYNIMWSICQWLVVGRWFSPGTPVSSTNKTDCHNITEILLKVVLNAITLTLISKLDPLDLTTFIEVTDQWSFCIINTEANGYNSPYIVFCVKINL